MNTRIMHRLDVYPAVEAPAMNGRWLARLPVVVGVVVALTMWVVTAGVLHAA